jgi:hypothetical protein
MTIAGAFVTSEGVVLGADSKTTFSLPNGDLQLLDHAQKVYQIGENSRFGLCTYGNGLLGSMSHRTVAARIADQVDPRNTTLNDVVQALTGILTTWAASEVPATNKLVGYFVGGIDLPARTPCCSNVVCEFGANASATPPFRIVRRDLAIGESLFGGAPHYMQRLFLGFDPGYPNELRDTLKSTVSNLPADFDQKFAAAHDNAKQKFVSLGMTAQLPLREAIDFVHTILQVTVKAFKFRMGVPLCGGPIEIGYISTDRPFRWAKHKPFDSAIRDNESLWTR